MAGLRRSSEMKDRRSIRSVNGRTIPVRGQVKVAIVSGLAQSLASLFSFNGRSCSSFQCLSYLNWYESYKVAFGWHNVADGKENELKKESGKGIQFHMLFANKAQQEVSSPDQFQQTSDLAIFSSKHQTSPSPFPSLLPRSISVNPPNLTLNWFCFFIRHHQEANPIECRVFVNRSASLRAFWKKIFAGLGVIPMVDSNLALLAKWPWRFRTESDALWVKVIQSIHGENGALDTKLEEKGTGVVGRVKIGDGVRTKFWTDQWHSRGTLKELFPRMFALDSEKDCSVASRIGVSTDYWPRRRNIRDGRERTEENNIKIMLEGVDIDNSREDKWSIPKAPNSVFSAAWIRDRLEIMKSMGSSYKNYWHKWIPIKDNIFIWRTKLDRIAVRKNLDLMNIDIPSTLCEFCKDAIESTPHIFFHCDLAAWMWSRVGLWCNMSIPLLNSIDDCIFWIDSLPQLAVRKDTLKAIVFALFKSIWTHRNELIFKNKKVEKEYVDPIVDRLDGKHYIRYRLSRAATRYQDGKHYRDLSKLNRDPSRILYVSGNALESCLQPEKCVPLKPWKCEADDTALVDLIPFLEYVARNRPADIRPVLASYHGHDIAKEFIERSKEHQRRMQAEEARWSVETLN
ncbi:hypothetical protein LXL04_034256 [Taraxacum kok-saghyz]